MDAELIRDAVDAAAGVERSTDGWRTSQTAPPQTIRKFRLRLKAFLEDLPGDLTVQDLREALEPAAQLEPAED